MRNKNGLLLAGLAAFAYYKYSKMSPESKRKMVDSVKEKVNQFVPENMRGMFDKFTGTQDSHSNRFAGSQDNSGFGSGQGSQGSSYAGSQGSPDYGRSTF